jgi:phage gpG-like protein
MRMRQHVRQVEGAQTAAMGASGGVVGAGSFGDILDQTAKFGELDALFGHMANEVQDGSYESRMDELVPLIQACEQRSFLAEQTPGGEAWTPLAESTIAHKGKRSGLIGAHSTILIDTGRLFESLTLEDGTSDTIWITGDKFLTFGTSVPYAIFHETGTSRMPARPAVGINDATADQIADAIGGFVVDKLREA